MPDFYHATPLEFNVLNKGSWVSSSLGEACLHLLMKNVEQKAKDRLEGFVLTLKDIDLSSMSLNMDLGDVSNHTLAHQIIDVHLHRQTFRQAIASLPENQQWIFHADDITDLRLFLNS